MAKIQFFAGRIKKQTGKRNYESFDIYSKRLEKNLSVLQNKSRTRQVIFFNKLNGSGFGNIVISIPAPGSVYLNQWK